jgi:hypothetical protein
MGRVTAWAQQHPRRASALMWALTAACVVATYLWQDRTGPTSPVRGTVATAKGPVSFEFLRSTTIETPLEVMLVGPVPDGVTAFVRYRRYTSADPWADLPLKTGDFTYTRRGVTTKRTGMGASLPGLPERAGKYEYFVWIDDGSGKPFSVTGEKAVMARFKGGVPTPVLIVHVVVIFLSMAVAVRTTLAAVVGMPFRRLMWATIASLGLGGFVLGPIVQWYAFGVWWSGIPVGTDWTDNKVVVELAAWLLAAWANRGSRTRRWPIVLAGIATLAVYLIPHSVFGSEFNYGSGPSRGTAG